MRRAILIEEEQAQLQAAGDVNHIMEAQALTILLVVVDLTVVQAGSGGSGW
jgi:hypothetical protein